MSGRKIEAALLLATVICISFPSTVFCGTQIDVGFGQNRFFLGEQFTVTFKDVIYWIAGIMMGFLFAGTFLFVTDADLGAALQQARGSSRGKIQIEKDEDQVDREGRLIGSKRYPTHLEERILKAIHTQPENYLGEHGRRQKRLIGGKRVPTGMEDRVLTKLDEPNNSFEDEDGSDYGSSAVFRLFKLLFTQL